MEWANNKKNQHFFKRFGYGGSDDSCSIAGTGPGSKLRKAKAFGVRTISYPELLRLIKERTGHPRLF